MLGKDEQTAILREKYLLLEEENARLKEKITQLEACEQARNIFATKTKELSQDPLYLEKLIALMPGHIYWHDLEGITLGCNDQQAKYFGFNSRFEVIGKSLYELFPEEEARDIIINNRKVAESGEAVIFQEESTSPFGETQYFISQKVPFKNIFGEVIGIFGVSIDITQRKQMERQLKEATEVAQKADRSKTEFLMNMSHDLRTPLAGILGVSERLFNQEQDLEKKQQLNMLRSAAEQLLALLNDILTFFRIEVEENSLKEEEINLNELIPALCNLFQDEAKKKGLDIKYTISNNITTEVVTDSLRLRRILLNLLSNAIKFTEVGVVEIEADFDASNSCLILKVIDSGIGIPEEYQEKIFDKFARVHSNIHTKYYEGSGIGLYLVNRFVKELGGSICVVSEEKIGTTFIISFPAELKQPTVYVPTMVEEAETDKLKENLSVLLVEDNPLAQLMGKQILSDLSCHFDLASSLEEARALLAKGKYELVLLDHGLPDGYGLELIEDVRQYQESCLIVGVSANHEEMVNVEGISKVIQKPLTKSKFIAIFNA